MLGTITSWDDVKGIGYITPQQGGRDIIFRALGNTLGFNEIKEGDRVSFEVTMNPSTGKGEATKVTVVE